MTTATRSRALTEDRAEVLGVGKAADETADADYKQATLDNEVFPVGVQERVTVAGETFSFCADDAVSEPIWQMPYAQFAEWRIGYRLLRHGRPGIPFLLWPPCDEAQEVTGYWYRVRPEKSASGEAELPKGLLHYRVLDCDLPPPACEFAFMPCGEPQPF